jgi:predicted AAA+ superfamily ATPase
LFEPRLTESLAGRAAFVDLWPLSQGEIGGMPAAINFDERDRRDFHRDYIRAMASRDVAELGRIPSTIDLTDLMRLLAARTAQEASQATLGKSLNVSSDVAARLTRMLESTYYCYRVPAWSRNISAKVVRKPKVHIVDVGLAATACGVTPEMLRDPTATIAGPLLETFVAGELARQLTWSETEASLYHWRDRDGGGSRAGATIW